MTGTPRLPRGALDEAAAAVSEAVSLDPALCRRIARAALSAALGTVQRDATRLAGRRVILLAELAAGLRCPACHGKAAASHYDHKASRSHYTCGCGAEWDGHRWAADDRTRSTDRSLALLAAGKPLPELPPKEGP